MFITFEGMEGSGKSTALNRVQQALLDEGHGVLLTREPGGSRLGRTLRSILLDLSNDDIVPEAELFLYLADRAQHVGQVIRPAWWCCPTATPTPPWSTRATGAGWTRSGCAN